MNCHRGTETQSENRRPLLFSLHLLCISVPLWRTRREQMKERRGLQLMAVAYILMLAYAFFIGLTDIAARAEQMAPGVPTGKPAAMIDLATDEGAKLVKGAWRYSDTRIVEV